MEPPRSLHPDRAITGSQVQPTANNAYLRRPTTPGNVPELVFASHHPIAGMRRLFEFIFLLGSVISLSVGRSSTKPPPGAVLVKPGTTVTGEFTNLGDALNALPADDTTQVVFVYPGTYAGQVNVSRPGPVTIMGYTENAFDFAQNTVTLVHSAALATGAASDDLTGTLRVLSNNVSLYNLDIRNDFGVAFTNGQAIALSNQGDQVGMYACRLFSYQDTLYTNVGNHVYLMSYIEGAVDFIFGRHSIAYFERNTIASKGAGCVTASGRELNDTGIYVFNENQVIAAPDAFPERHWEYWARVIFKNTFIPAPMNKTIWSIWDPGDDRTDFVLLAEYNSFGPGVVGAHRPNFSTILDREEAAQYSLESAIPNYRDWVDTEYLLPELLEN
ncbi:Pectinesterase [Mycena sanguinolenta]|uniref:Pectinesterase n=1 Tax=Mycena sanguinolenta TaxID=230812 RepID=A0A8H6XXH8_9AGAR|nr:Pectinesterase [Mycena sanguinolenta]